MELLFVFSVKHIYIAVIISVLLCVQNLALTFHFQHTALQIKNVHIDSKILLQTDAHYKLLRCDTLFDVIGIKESEIKDSFDYIVLSLVQQNKDSKSQNDELELFIRELNDKRTKFDQQMQVILNDDSERDTAVLGHISSLLQKLHDLKKRVFEADLTRQQTHGSASSGNWIIVDDWMEKKQQEQQVYTDIEEATMQIKSLLSEQMGLYDQFHEQFLEHVTPLVDLGFRFHELRDTHDRFYETVKDQNAELETRLDRLIAFSKLPSAYHDCVEEVVRRVNFKDQEYISEVKRMNSMLELIQQQENYKRTEFFQKFFKNTKGHRAVLFDILVEKLMPCLDKIHLVPKLDNVEIRQFDEMLPEKEVGTDSHGSSSWFITGDSQIMIEHIPFDNATVSATDTMNNRQLTEVSESLLEYDVDELMTHTSDSDFSDTESMDSLSPIDNDELVNLLNLKEMEIATLQQSIRTLSTSNSGTSNNTTFSTDREARLEKRIATLESQLAEREEQQSQASETILQQRSTIEEQAARNRKLQGDLEQAHREQSELKTLLVSRDESIFELNQELSNKDTQLQALQNVNNEQYEQLMILEVDDNTKKEELKTVRAQMMRFAAVIDDLQKKLQSIEGENVTYNQKLQDFAKHNTELEQDKLRLQLLVDETKKESNAFEQQLEVSLEENDVLRKQVNNMEGFLQDVLSEQNNKEKDANVLKKQCEDLQTQLKNVQSEAAQREKALLDEQEAAQKHTQEQHENALAALLEELREAERNSLLLREETDHMQFALQNKMDSLQQQLKDATEKNAKLLGINKKLLNLISEKGRVKPNEIKIAVNNFEHNDTVIFFRDCNSKGVEHFEVFHQNSPHYYLSPQAMSELKKLPEWKDLTFLRVSILNIEEIKASDEYNPFKLPIGTSFFEVHPYPFENTTFYNH